MLVVRTERQEAGPGMRAVPRQRHSRVDARQASRPESVALADYSDRAARAASGREASLLVEANTAPRVMIIAQKSWSAPAAVNIRQDADPSGRVDEWRRTASSQEVRG